MNENSNNIKYCKSEGHKILENENKLIICKRNNFQLILTI